MVHFYARFLLLKARFSRSVAQCFYDRFIFRKFFLLYTKFIRKINNMQAGIFIFRPPRIFYISP